MTRETSSASLQHVTGSVDAKAFEVVEAIFRDLRDRRFLKWIFDERGDACFIANFADGEPLKGLDLEVQGQIKDSWQAIISRALTPAPQTHLVGDADVQAAINLGAAVLTRIEDPAAREIAIRNALTMASQAPSPSTRSDLYDADVFMADGGDTPMTAAENLLAWLLVEKIGVPDDVGYSPNQAQEIIVRRLDLAHELEQIDGMLSEGQGDDEGHPIMPEFTKGMTTYAKVEACLHLLERRRDALHPSPQSREAGQ
ncbi:hypothetical protein GOL87_25140 [Sinorhizobium medicae]|nr:hypothetical protein [Sinorhizobium medicae]